MIRSRQALPALWLILASFSLDTAFLFQRLVRLGEIYKGPITNALNALYSLK